MPKLRNPSIITLEGLSKEPYTTILCYPKPNETEIQNRLTQLDALGVEALEFTGQASAFNVPVLGKGYVGIVVVAHVNGQRVALKMRRVDADRKNLEHEAELLIKANSVNVGPKFIAVNKDFLLMQLVDGDLLSDWLETHRETEIMRKVLVDILEQCWRLDEIGLDHGELSKAPKHLLVDKAQKLFIVDFETASVERKVANVTAVCQFLFVGNSTAAKILAETCGERNRSELIAALKSYKKTRNRKNFEGLLEICLS
jgi:putative serine/threonine protein kinase